MAVYPAPPDQPVEPDAPVGAIINEAVELAKRYGSENSGKFVNGALGTVAARITAGELTRQPRPTEP